MDRLGIVTIGRNEGDRLQRCLHSLLALSPPGTPIVYVDSGSSDNSVRMTRDLGIDVLELDLSVPFTMARGRNTGFFHLIRKYPSLEYVQFIDGDCELLAGWLENAVETLDNDPELAIVCGRRRERYPEASVYNLLADIEWNTPIGATKFCGGDALIRIKAILPIGAYNPTLICGEEPEMCIRLRREGWKIRRIDRDMTLHDAAMSRFSQWWLRCVRYGWAVAEGKFLHGGAPEYYMKREYTSGWFWGAILPLLILLSLPFTYGAGSLGIVLYLILMFKIYRYRSQNGDDKRLSSLYAFWCVLEKIPRAIGQGKYLVNRWRDKPARIIEYKAIGITDKSDREPVSENIH